MYDIDAALFIRRHCSLFGTGAITGKLFDLGTYPCVVFEADAKNFVFGELFKIESTHEYHAKYLDEYE